ncbi:preprotein translocase subunit SecA [Peptoclostridium litorale DSM 5388]|uniref:Protein translocase subunit SecA n=1 Tax=Peptoclostridium litorale DSM 5388 TaxID=1121324 RepID=A0A069RBB2_PEPLI|nr:preprotein translocase subunit SecA [Peptoclostridium litorale]KDR94359.1 protein translocase subunit SecA [Peptoclostridium litorale DSM 5388]SIO25197.1 preprotein translocase subunit SecA [Peptoclostridium litorale DSM 5388]
MNFLKELIFGGNKKEIKKVEKLVDQIEAIEDRFTALSDEELKGMTGKFKERIQKGESLDDILPEAFATVREAGKRVLGMRHYRVQLIGGVVLHQGRIAEMKTGEGKTLVATLPVYLNALTGKGVHVITVNDYLAKRDMEWMGKLYEFLGLSVGVAVHGQSPSERKYAYACDITYGTNNEFGFDYLRDNMVIYKERMVQRELNFAIVDEVDSILIDEARTPLIISGPGDKSTGLYIQANTFVQMLQGRKMDPSEEKQSKFDREYKEETVDFVIDEKGNSVMITENGVEKAEKFFGVENLADSSNMELSHHINQALKANNLMKNDVDYVVKDGEIIIVDEFTGRLMFGRRYSDGLHQAIEAKEGLDVQRESQTLASITFQNYFRMYSKLSGMTGTAKTEEEEFRSIYGMDVVQIPTNKPIKRKDEPDVVYKSEKGKFKAVVEEIEERYKTGQPILVGTIAIETSEMLSSVLKRKGIKHQVLNAKQHEKEAEIVAQAGRLGNVTIATNMAGRGTDIVLGGNPEFMTKKEMRKLGYSEHIISLATGFAETDDPEILDARNHYSEVYSKIKGETDAEQEKVKAAGGLCILGTERHESRRIDNQLRGRAGRQGDNGMSRFYISLEDDIMRLFGSEKIKGVVEKLGMDDDTPIEHAILSKSIENAQKKVEGRNFGIRKHVLQFDDVMNKQREIIYKERRSVLEGENIRENIVSMIQKTIEHYADIYTSDGSYPEEWDIAGLKEHLYSTFLPKGSIDFGDIEQLDRQKIKDMLIDTAMGIYEEKEQMIGEERMREIERIMLLQVVDTKWVDHIDAMDQLRQGIGLRAIGQEDPVRAYQFEGFDMFEDMIRLIHEDTIKYLFGFTVEEKIERKQVIDVDNLSQSSGEDQRQPVSKEDKVGRNDICPCGSGKKYKKCCGKNK